MYAGLPQGSPSQLSSGPSLNRYAYVRTNGAGKAINFAEVCGTSISGKGYALSKCLSFFLLPYHPTIMILKHQLDYHHSALIYRVGFWSGLFTSLISRL